MNQKKSVLLTPWLKKTYRKLWINPIVINDSEVNNAENKCVELFKFFKKIMNFLKMNKNFKKTIHYLLVLIFSRITLYGQNSNSWSYFYNKKVTLVGFKDSKGIVQIKPKFATMTPAVIFDDIMAAMEEKNGKPIISPNRCYYFGL